MIILLYKKAKYSAPKIVCTIIYLSQAYIPMGKESTTSKHEFHKYYIETLDPNRY